MRKRGDEGGGETNEMKEASWRNKSKAAAAFLRNDASRLASDWCEALRIRNENVQAGSSGESRLNQGARLDGGLSPFSTGPWQSTVARLGENKISVQVRHNFRLIFSLNIHFQRGALILPVYARSCLKVPPAIS